jgi:hypothetical protein
MYNSFMNEELEEGLKALKRYHDEDMAKALEIHDEENLICHLKYREHWIDRHMFLTVFGQMVLLFVMMMFFIWVCSS